MKTWNKPDVVAIDVTATKQSKNSHNPCTYNPSNWCNSSANGKNAECVIYGYCKGEQACKYYSGGADSVDPTGKMS